MDTTLPTWLDPLVCLTDFDGDAEKYLDHLYSLFQRDFVSNALQFRDKKVLFDKKDDNGKPAAFVHVTTEEDKMTGQRNISLRRCERITWIKAIIEHCDDPAVLLWEKEHFGSQRISKRIYLFLECDNFLVILEELKHGHFMITAIYVDSPHQKRKHLKDYGEYQKNKSTA